ncbi:MAG: RDD family protein [Burkholderiales bacterium]|jgi:uncharacterized RDD family membrane protein YckC|nr:RDD family protein [Burkholderiales bacterium]
MSATVDTPPLARRWPRFAAMVYEGFLLVAIAFIGALLFLKLVGDASGGWRRHALQGWLLALWALYFTWFWTRSGQTLPMKTWGLRVVGRDGARLRRGPAVARFVVAAIGTLSAGLGLIWSFVDREGLFLHDRLLGTRIVKAPI